MKTAKYLGIVIGIALLALVVYIAKPIDVFKAISSANFLFLLAGFIVFVPTMFVRAVRWKYLIKGRVGFKIIFKALCIGTLANNILPSKIGAVIRAGILSKKGKKGVGSSFASVFFDNVVEISFVLLSCLVISYLTLFSGFEKLKNTIFAGIIVFLGFLVLVFIAYLVFHSKTCWGFLMRFDFLRKAKEKYGKNLAKDVKGYMGFMKMKNLLISYLLTGVIWLNTAIVSYFVVRSLNYNTPFSIIYIASTLPFIIGMASLLPGGYGVQDASMAGILYLGGIELAAAASIAIIFRVIYLIWVAFLGIWSGYSIIGREQA